VDPSPPHAYSPPKCDSEVALIVSERIFWIQSDHTVKLGLTAPPVPPKFKNSKTWSKVSAGALCLPDLANQNPVNSELSKPKLSLPGVDPKNLSSIHHFTKVTFVDSQPLPPQNTWRDFPPHLVF
jgi:hypothetical protein